MCAARPARAQSPHAAGTTTAAPTAPPPPGAPPTFGTAPVAGPEVSAATFAEAEKLVQVELSRADREMAAASWRTSMAALYERRTGPRKAVLEPELAPASRWIPLGAGERGTAAVHDRFVRSAADAILLSGERRGDCLLSGHASFALDRDSKAHLGAPHENLFGSAQTVRSKTALCHHAHVRKRAGAGKERGRGNRLGKVSRAAARGISWGAKDLLDTTGIATTYGGVNHSGTVYPPSMPR